MAREAGPLSGFRDTLPGQMIPRQQMLNTIRGVYEGYGFTPLDTPIIERGETLDDKYGEEGQKLMYRFRDHGDRDIALRYDLTVPLARVVAQHGADLPKPFKRYQIGQVFRGESPQAGRYREFTQFDADTVGTQSPIADAEVVVMMADSMEALGANAKVRVNNRRILDGLVEKAGVGEDARGYIGIVDKVEKVGDTAALDEIVARYGDRAAAITAQYLELNGTAQERLLTLDHLLRGTDGADEGISNMQTVFRLVEQGSGYGSDKIVFDQRIARGLDYYTGIVYETTLVDLPNLGSVSSGGRYDNLVAQLGGPDLPAVGTSIGVDRLLTGLQELHPTEDRKTPAEIMIANFGDENAAQYLGMATALRRAGVPTEIHYEPSKLRRQFRDADQSGVPYVLLAGPQELEEDIVKVRNMKTGQEEVLPIADLPQAFTAMRSTSQE